MKKIIFLDIDGTLIDHDVLHGIPESTKEAIAMARENGHKCIICTGRVKSSVSHDVHDLGFDGAIYAAGCHVEVNDQKLFYTQLEPEIVRLVLDTLNQLGIGYSMEGEHKTFQDELAHQRFLTMFKEREGMNSEMARFAISTMNFSSISELNPDLDPINKCTFFAPDMAAIEKMEKVLSPYFKILVHGEKRMGLINGEMIKLGISKASGMDVILEHYGLDLADTFAYGDSLNDEEMILHAKVGIAMGNGRESIKQIADDVCERVDQDAIYKSFKKYGLI